MSLRWPDLELLRRGRGELIALSPLSQASARRTMIEALRRIEPALAAVRDGGPDVAIVEALAACVEVMGFYHDRFLTESKLGSAQLLDDLGKIVALIGYRPLPAIAATAFQFFEAIATGSVAAGTRVAGKTRVPPATIAFETDALIEISPAHNRMALSPLITRSAAAVRAVLAPLARDPALPTDDFRPQTTAMVADAQGLELAPVSGSRSRGVAFGRPLSRSFDQTSAQVSRTTVIRRLGAPRALSDELVAFEVSETPILHRPSAAAPELLTSSLEIFVLRPGDDALDPSEWDPALRYTEVFDFSASEVSDLHYRKFVDDALHTWVIVRRALGAHLLLDTDALARVYARFIPAIGAVLDPPGDTPEGAPAMPSLTDVTLGLDAGYFDSSLVLPSVANTRLVARATWAMVDRDLGVLPGDSILIQDGNGQRWVRTLIDRAPGASPRLLRWAEDPPTAPVTGGLPEAHDPVDGVLDPASAKIGSLADAARGDAFPTWSELYAQLEPPGPPEPASDLPIAPSSPDGRIERQRVVAPGTTHLVLRDASHVVAGDYLLLGSRLTAAFRAPQPFGYWRWKPSEPPFDPRTPWLDAEVVQALEVRGNVVRLANPVSQAYFIHRGRVVPTAEPVVMSEVIVVPGVVSVASGDQLRQTMSLPTQPVYRGSDEQLHDASYVNALLDRPDYLAGALRRPLLPAGGTQPAAELWRSLFVAVAGVAEAQVAPVWTLDVVVRNLRAPAAQIVRLETDTGEAITDDGIAGALGTEAPIRVRDNATAPRIADDGAAIAVLETPASWERVGSVPAAGEFTVVDATSFDLIPEPADLASEPLLRAGGTLVLIPTDADELVVPFRWDAVAHAPRVQGIAPVMSTQFEALLMSDAQTVDLELVRDEIGIDWRVPAARLELGALEAGTLVGASSDGEIVLDTAFTRDGDDVVLVDVRRGSRTDPLHDAAAAWAVLPERQIAATDVEARWTYALNAALPPNAPVRLALVGEQRAMVAAHTSADGRSVSVDADVSQRAGDLGFALDQLCVLDAAPLPGSAITASTMWAWQAIDPPLVDLPEPCDTLFVAVIDDALVRWPREDAWWDPARRTLRLPTAPLDATGARPAGAVRLLQVLAPVIDTRHIAFQYHRTTDRTIATLWLPAGWPSQGLAPAPVVIGTPAHGASEVRDLIAPVEVLTDPRGRVRWTMHFAGDVRRCWRSLAVTVRDWPAPVERGLEIVPVWRIPAPAGRAVNAPVTLIVALDACAGFVAVAAMPRQNGDVLELVPYGRDDEFPAVAAVTALDVAIQSIASTASAPVALRGTTRLALAAGAPEAIAVAFVDGLAWQPIHVERIAALPDGRRGYELDRAYLSVFPDGIPAEQAVRLCVATSDVGTSAPLATARTLRLRLSMPDGAAGLGANAAVFHADDDLANRSVLATASPPRMDGDVLVVELAIDQALGALLVADRVALAQRWGTEIDKTLVRQPVRVRLGSASPYPIAVGDVVHFEFASDAPVSAVVRAIDPDGLLDLATATLTALPDELRLHGLRTPIATADCTATLELLPSSQQPPWLLSFDNHPSPASLLATMLPYAATEVIGARRRFRFRDHAQLAEIFRRVGDTLFLFTNERDELRGDFYTRSDDAISTTLGAVVANFLDADANAKIDRLVLTTAAWAGKDLERPRPVVLGSTAWVPSAAPPRLPPELFPELQIASAVGGRVATHTVLQSTRFPSGNFIPVAGQGGTPANAAATIASALRVSAIPIDGDGNPLPGQSWRPVTFVPLEELGTTSATLTRDAKSAPGALAAFEGMTFREAVLSGALDDTSTRYVYSAAFSAAGACTLHFLIIDDALRESVRVRIEAQYEVNPGRTGDGLVDPVYALETPVTPLDPAARLALLAPGSIKPGALLFVRMPQAPQIPALQWTRVTRVNGSIVDIAPPIAYEPGTASALEPIEVTALGPLTSAARLDADYYASVAKTKLVPGGPLVQPLRDRLALDVIARPAGADTSLIASLIPGDLVLVIDERLRRAWAAQRRGDPGSDRDWRQWPDFQHQAVIKRIDADSGLVVLAAPLPDQFQIRWQLDAASGRLAADARDVAALRVLPHYRAPIQGRRTLSVLGSGDSTRRFARFVTSLDASAGSAVVPLDADGVSTGNLEVLAFDPEKAAWSRWLRHDDLARAGKKAPAFVLGFRPATTGRAIPVSVTFGDGLTGQLLPTGTDNVFLRSTKIGATATWLARPHRVAIVSRAIAAGPVRVVTGDAPPANLVLRIACTAPTELAGSGDASPRWRPALELTVTLPDGTTREFHAISEDAAARGAHGFLVVSRLDMPPGVVDAYLYAPIALPERSPVVASLVPGTRQWSLDAEAYAALSAPDLTAEPGATNLQLLSTTGLRAGSRLALFATPDSPPDVVRLASIDPPSWTAVVEQPLARAYDLARSFIRGNVVAIVQGAVDRTTIGSSDGTTASLRLPLGNRAPLLYRVEPGGSPAPDVRVLIADQPWTRVVDFATAGPASRVWRLDVDPDGTASVVFGDGRHGAIPPAGRDHIDAIVRLGSGAPGNLPAGAIDKLVTGNLAVRSTMNLVPAAGGSAGDTPATARERAFARRLPSDRVVSAVDCVRTAIGENDVIAAALDPTAPGDQLRLVIALAQRRAPTAADLAAVHDRVTGAMPLTAHTRLAVVAAAQTAVHLVIELGVRGDALAADVFAAVAMAFGTAPDQFFAADRWEIGEPLRLGDVYDAIFQIRGVAHARVLWMAGAPLPEGTQPHAPAPDVFDPGATGVVRCDNDAVADPFGRRGTLRLQQVEVTP